MKDLQIGKVLKPQGIKGEIKIELYDKNMNFDGIDCVIIGGENFAVSHFSVRQGFLYLLLEGVYIAEAEQLRNKPVYISGEVAQSRLGENQHYIENIINFSVFLSDGQKVGSLKEVQEYSTNDVMVIAKAGGKEILLPIVNDVIEIIEEENQKIVLNKTKFEEMSVYED